MTISERIYAVLLRAYPASLQAEYGELMAQLFRDQLRDAVAGSKLISFWRRIIMDLLKTALASQWEHVPGRDLAAGGLAIVVACFGKGYVSADPATRSLQIPWISSLWLRSLRFPWPYSLVYEVGVYVVLDTLTLVAAFSIFLAITRRLSLRKLLRGVLTAFPLLAIGRVGCMFQGSLGAPIILWYVSPWVVLFSALALSISTTRSNGILGFPNHP